MSEDKKSRYAKVPLTTFEHVSGEEFPLRELREIPSPASVFSHTAKEGERLDRGYMHRMAAGLGVEDLLSSAFEAAA